MTVDRGSIVPGWREGSHGSQAREKPEIRFSPFK